MTKLLAKNAEQLSVDFLQVGYYKKAYKWTEEGIQALKIMFDSEKSEDEKRKLRERHYQLTLRLSELDLKLTQDGSHMRF